MVNKVMLLGRLGRDPELKMLPGGKNSVVNFTMATSENKKINEKWEKVTEWHRVIVWGRQAESCDKYLSKGSQVFIEGRLQTRSWEDKLGQKKSVTEIVASNVQFVGAKSNENGANKAPGENYDDWSASKQKTPNTISQAREYLESATPTFTQDDIPFAPHPSDF